MGKECLNCKYKIGNDFLSEQNWKTANSLVLKHIKSTLNEEGYWNGDFEGWDDIVSVCNLETMITFGVSFDERWQVTKKNGVSYDIGLIDVVNYINSKIIKKGSEFEFGEDVWDLFRLVLVIKKLKLEKHFSQYKLMEKFCISLCEKYEKMDTHNKWAGPAVIALAIELCGLCGKFKQKNALTDYLMQIRNADGSWGDTKDASLCIWHTSQVVNIITIDEQEEKRSIQAILNLLNSDSFQKEYYLRDYYASYAVWAIYNKGLIDNESFIKILEDIKNRLENGQIRDRGSLSMIGTILSRMFTKSGQFIDVMLREEELLRYIEENKKLSKENSDLRKKMERFSDGGVYISSKTIKVLGWLLGVVVAAVITTVITLLMGG